ncbi:hypothetical protein N7523_010253 [Penicillium sp. IBT 18751x]|nr:hypothetical protein N7523_010253 [Penicillium sp. IBT 18751x]
MHFKIILLTTGLLLSLVLSQTITVDVNENGECIYMGRDLQGCTGSSKPFGKAHGDKNKDCSGHEGYPFLDICGAFKDGRDTAYIARGVAPGGDLNEDEKNLRAIAYLDNGNQDTPVLYCELPSYTSGASCTATALPTTATSTPFAKATPSSAQIK